MNKVILFLSICMVALRVTAQNGVSQSVWFSKPIIAEGIPTEWNQPLNLYDSNSKIFFQMANDSNNLYLCFQVQDIGEQMRIISSGMKVSLLTKAKKKIKASIQFPLEDVESFDHQNIESQTPRKLDIREIRNRVKLLKTTMETNGFATCNGTSPINEKGKINVGIDWDAKNVMCYEVSIPFKELFDSNYTVKYLQEIMTLKIDINASQVTGGDGFDPPKGQGAVGGMPSGGGMGPNGGISSGMNMQPEGALNSRTSTSQHVKQKFRLTVK